MELLLRREIQQKGKSQIILTLFDTNLSPKGWNKIIFMLFGIYNPIMTLKSKMNIRVFRDNPIHSKKTQKREKT
jgi:hypothetical protein